jgi:hypothetical protein
MAKRKPVNRKMSPPPVPLEGIDGEVVGFPFLNLDEAEGFYKIDSFKSYFADIPQDVTYPAVPPYQDVRMFVEHAAMRACIGTSSEARSVEVYKFAHGAISDLEKIRRIAKRLLKMAPENFADLFNAGTRLTEPASKIGQNEQQMRQTAELDAFAHGRPYVPPPPIVRFISAHETYCALKDLDIKVEALLHDRKLRERQLVPSRSDPMARVFIDEISGFWKDCTGANPPPGDQAALIRFLVAAWEDLKFPEPIDRKGKPKPLLDWFTERVPKRRVKRKFTFHGI